MDVSQYIAGEMRIASHHVHILPNNAQYAKLGTPWPGASIAITSIIIGTAEDTTAEVAVKRLPLELWDISFISDGDSHATTSKIKGMYNYFGALSTLHCWQVNVLNGEREAKVMTQTKNLHCPLQQ
jgi:hypothetical protein